MARIERTARFSAPVSEVFDYIADFRTLKEYNPSVREVACLTPEPPGEGSRFEIRLAAPVGSIRAVLTVTEFSRNELIATSLESLLPARERREFRADGDGTLFSFTIEFASGWPLVGSLADRLLARLFAEPQADTEIRLLRERFHRQPSG